MDSSDEEDDPVTDFYNTIHDYRKALALNAKNYVNYKNILKRLLGTTD